MEDKIAGIIYDSIAIRENLIATSGMVARIENAAIAILGAFRSGHRLYLCGNGGSAADAQHIAAELTGRFYKDRPALPAEALHGNSSYITAVANDYGYDQVYARMIAGTGKPGDVLIALSTSGNSPNIVEACKAAREKGLVVIGMTGENGGAMAAFCDHLLTVPSTVTPRIQECHILVGHILCELVEEEYFE